MSAPTKIDMRMAPMPEDVLRMLRGLPLVKIGDSMAPKQAIRFTVDGSEQSLVLGFRPAESVIGRSDAAYLGWLFDGPHMVPSEFAVFGCIVNGRHTVAAIDVNTMFDGVTIDGLDEPMIPALFLRSPEVVVPTSPPGPGIVFRRIEEVN